MDILTHGLASLAVARGFFSRAGKAAVVSAILAGTIADIDWLSRYFGPSPYLRWNGTYFHSILAAAAISLVLSAMALALFDRKRVGRAAIAPMETPADSQVPETPQRPASSPRSFILFAASLAAALLHIAMDACQSEGVTLLWPFRSKRFAADWLPGIDPWILTILIAAIAIPELLNLVSSEIGAKSKKPRGRTGAIIGLVLVVVYIGARATLHTNAVALMESRTFHGEPARRASAFPESLSLIVWHGIAETESALDEIEVNLSASGSFDADLSLRIFKPQPSPTLDAARNTGVAKEFLLTAQIPKASVEKTDVGYVVILRDLRYAAAGETQHEIAALIELDPDNKVTSQELVWARDLRN